MKKSPAMRGFLLLRPGRAWLRSIRLPQLFQDRGVLQGRGVLRDALALGHRTQQAPHDLARAGLGQVVAEADVLGLGDRTDLLGHMVAQLLGDGLGLVARGAGALEHDEGADRLARGVVGAADHGRLGHQLGAADQGRLDLHRAHAVARHVQHIVDATGDGEVAGLGIADGAVARQVIALELTGVVALLEALRVAPDRADHRGPRLLDDQDAALPVRHIVAEFVDDGRRDAREGQGAGARHQGRGARQRRDHMAAGLRLPEGVDDGAAAAADVLVVPLPGSGVDGLADRAQQAQAAQVVALGVHGLVALGRLDQRADRGGRGVEDRPCTLR
eukprot:Opistho-1_new@98791